MADRFVSSTASGAGDGESEASPWTLLQAQNNASGDDVWIKADGDYPLATLGVNTFSPVNAGNRFRGYQSTPGDMSHPGVVFDLEQLSGPMVTLGQDDTVLENIDVKNGATSGPRHGVIVTGAFCLVRRVRVDGISKNAFRLGAAGGLADECEAVNFSLSGGAAGFLLEANNTRCSNCIAHDSVGAGFQVAAGDAAANGFDGCIAANNSGAGFAISSTPGNVISLRHCVSIGNAAGVAVSEVFGDDAELINCVMGANTVGIAGHASAQSRVRLAGLARWGNGSEVSGNVDVRDLGEIIDLPADPFVDSGGPQYDFRLRSDQRAIVGVGSARGFIVNGLTATWFSAADYGAVQTPVSPVFNPLIG